MAEKGIVVSALTKDAKLKRDIRKELGALGFKRANGTLISPSLESKADIRETHHAQRTAVLLKNSDFITSSIDELSGFFADGSLIEPSLIRLELERIRPGTQQARLFRLAGLTWSVPVSNGFGRRLRYLVWDTHHEKLAGIIALGDPVYNLKVREQEIGWDSETKRDRLVNVLDAYVLGAVPPYNQLLVGKTLACLVRTQEIVRDFRVTYGSTAGVISGKEKHAQLLAITTSSSLGKSSVYNRLKLGQQQYFKPIGFTSGWGHFHISDSLFLEMRRYLRESKHPYADNNRFGNGPNWKLRTIRTALEALGFDPGILRHGIQREAFICTTAKNSLEALRAPPGQAVTPDFSCLESVSEVAEAGLRRWTIPRSERRNDYAVHSSREFLDSLQNDCSRVAERKKIERK